MLLNNRDLHPQRSNPTVPSVVISIIVIHGDSQAPALGVPLLVLPSQIWAEASALWSKSWAQSAFGKRWKICHLSSDKKRSCVLPSQVPATASSWVEGSPWQPNVMLFQTRRETDVADGCWWRLGRPVPWVVTKTTLLKPMGVLAA